ncbi:transporter substrate-binding domain-containing protein [Motilimonas cestriensis]|uniref:Transporter substrate-binding domain-containing protein n=1 Tax=Motilimonas cestriensis TaxID=2742685 RepID=A0ABS8W811_9GAMM|nr:transporter substrate-binding domain-containing protein [Motilimonas cestriensis]MCE2595124.1 transporter substrate-binding domain-containing protein [Motilimonas cestriensis]
MIWLRRLLLILTIVPSFTQAELTILTSHEPPMNFEQHGKMDGITTDYVKLLMKHVETPSEIQIAPWARVLEAGMQQRNTLIFSAERNPQREEHFYWIGPVMAKRWYFIARDTTQFPYQQLAQYKEVDNIGVLRADNRETWLKAQGFSNGYPVSNLEQAYKMLMSERLDLVLTGDIEHAYMLSHHPEYRSLVTVFYVTTAYSYLAFSRNTDPAILKQWQNAFEQQKHSLDLKQIQQRWSQKLDRELQLNNGMFEFSN